MKEKLRPLLCLKSEYTFGDIFYEPESPIELEEYELSIEKIPVSVKAIYRTKMFTSQFSELSDPNFEFKKQAYYYQFHFEQFLNMTGIGFVVLDSERLVNDKGVMIVENLNRRTYYLSEDLPDENSKASVDLWMILNPYDINKDSDELLRSFGFFI